MSLQRKVADMVRMHSMFAPGDLVVVGVSGGADSIALLHALRGLASFNLSLVVAHVNHGLRGEFGDRDEQFVRGAAMALGLPVETVRIDVAHVARQQGLSLEEAGRNVRYDFFRELAGKTGARRIAVAHTADDQAETVLMRLLRGSGPSGVAGMSPVTDGGIVRPLLSCSRQDVTAFLAHIGQPWQEDETNADTGFLRNRIRHEVLPQLSQINPGIGQALRNLGKLSASDDLFLSSLADDEFGRMAVCKPDGVCLDVEALTRLAPPIRYRVIRRAVREAKGSLRRISFIHIESVDGLLLGQRPNVRLDLPGAVVVRAYERLVISNKRTIVSEWIVDIGGFGTYSLPNGMYLQVTVAPDFCPRGEQDDNVMEIDLDAVPFPWQVRSFRPADRISVAGLEGRKKVKKLFMEKKIPVGERLEVPLLVAGGEILWVCGLRRSDRGRPDVNCQSCVRVAVGII